MAFALLKEKRLSERKKLTGLLPGPLKRLGREESLSCKPINVSKHGLGILMNERLTEGSKLVLVVKEKKINLEVAWLQDDFGKEDLIRYGLVTLDQDVDLEEIFLVSGCIK